jgi:hypothetical protein
MWITPDPMAEKYYGVSPYVYCLNNPVNYIDPYGMDVFITGLLNKEALRQLQQRIGNRITLSLNDEYKLNYTINVDGKLKGMAKRIVEIIDDNSIIVNLITTDKNTTSTGNLMVGGAFMGNIVSNNDIENLKVTANQEINPNILEIADEFTKTPGKLIMHELTEAYEGARISQKTGVGVGAATQADVTNPISVYNKAHNKATPQTNVYQTIYDKNGRKLEEKDIHKAVKVEWHVTRFFRKKIIQTFP